MPEAIIVFDLVLNNFNQNQEQQCTQYQERYMTKLVYQNLLTNKND